MVRLPFLDVLAAAPRWQKLVFGGVALAACSAAAYFIAVLPVEGRVTTLRGQRDTQAAEITRLRALAAELARVRREAAEVERQLEVVKEKLPTQREIPALYRTLSDAAVQAGLAVALFQPQGPRVRDFYSEIPITLVAEGGYHEFGHFLGRMAMLPRATMVSELKLTGPRAGAPAPPRADLRLPAPDGRPRASVTDSGKPSRSVRFEITLMTYVYRPVGSPPAPKPAGAAKPAEAPKS